LKSSHGEVVEIEWTIIVATLFAYLLYCWKTICCIVDEQLAVFVGEKFVVLVVLPIYYMLVLYY
jgi:hypothetical protein